MAAPQHALYLPRLVLDWLREKPQDASGSVHGTLIFADVSGFTALSDRLAIEMGRGGSEKVTSVMNEALNITNLLEAEGMSWHDVVRTTNYLRDIERDYAEFNKIRTSFYQWLNLDPLPAATGIQVRLCWETLLVEIEVYAICKAN